MAGSEYVGDSFVVGASDVVVEDVSVVVGAWLVVETINEAVKASILVDATMVV